MRVFCAEARRAEAFCAETRRTGPRPLPSTQDYTQGGWEGAWASFCAETRRSGPRSLPSTQDYTQGGWAGAWAFLCARRCVAPGLFCAETRRAGPLPLPTTQDYTQGGWKGERASSCAGAHRLAGGYILRKRMELVFSHLPDARWTLAQVVLPSSQSFIMMHRRLPRRLQRPVSDRPL